MVGFARSCGSFALHLELGGRGVGLETAAREHLEVEGLDLVPKHVLSAVSAGNTAEDHAVQEGVATSWKGAGRPLL